MNKRMLNKLRAQAGETIAEVLIAMFISVLGVAMLVGMIGASVRIIENSNRVMQEEYSKTRVTADAEGNPSVKVFKEDNTPVKVGEQQLSFAVINQKHGDEVIYYVPKTS